MKYMHQHIIHTGQNYLNTADDLANFLLSLDSIKLDVQEVVDHQSLLKQQGKLLSGTIEFLTSNRYKAVKIFNTAEDRYDYMLWVKDYNNRVWDVLNLIGWSYEYRDVLSEITEERWQQIQQENTTPV